jgi:hypothetical protein
MGKGQETTEQMKAKPTMIMLLAISLLASIGIAHADLGWTLDQCKAKYGKPTLGPLKIAGRISYSFQVKHFQVGIFLLHGKVSRMMYGTYGNLESEVVQLLLRRNVPGVAWKDGEKDEDDPKKTNYPCSKAGYYAFSTVEPSGFKALVVCTQADVDAVSESDIADAANDL